MKGLVWMMKGRWVSSIAFTQGVALGLCVYPLRGILLLVLPGTHSLKRKYLPAQGTALCDTGHTYPDISVTFILQ